MCKKSCSRDRFHSSILVFLTHILAIKVAKDHCKNSENQNLFTKFDWMLTKFVSKILIVKLLFLVIYIVISVCYFLMNKKVEKNGRSWLNFALHSGYLVSYCNSFSHALLFLKMSKSKNLKMHVFCRSARVRPQDTPGCRHQNQEVVS